MRVGAHSWRYFELAARAENRTPHDLLKQVLRAGIEARETERARIEASAAPTKALTTG